MMTDHPDILIHALGALSGGLVALGVTLLVLSRLLPAHPKVALKSDSSETA